MNMILHTAEPKWRVDKATLKILAEDFKTVRRLTAYAMVAKRGKMPCPAEITAFLQGVGVGTSVMVTWFNFCIGDGTFYLRGRKVGPSGEPFEFNLVDLGLLFGTPDQVTRQAREWKRLQRYEKRVTEMSAAALASLEALEQARENMRAAKKSYKEAVRQVQKRMATRPPAGTQPEGKRNGQ